MQSRRRQINVIDQLRDSDSSAENSGIKDCSGNRNGNVVTCCADVQRIWCFCTLHDDAKRIRLLMITVIEVARCRGSDCLAQRQPARYCLQSPVFVTSACSWSVAWALYRIRFKYSIRRPTWERHTFVPDVHLMTSHELTFCFYIWSC